MAGFVIYMKSIKKGQLLTKPLNYANIVGQAKNLDLIVNRSYIYVLDAFLLVSPGI